MKRKLPEIFVAIAMLIALCYSLKNATARADEAVSIHDNVVQDSTIWGKAQLFEAKDGSNAYIRYGLRDDGSVTWKQVPAPEGETPNDPNPAEAK